ncbi:MAG: hypothetical protein IH987_11605 [Planctomycetes bacterium]|nr:hypothetical protein [Planctomycetota bacterium]
MEVFILSQQGFEWEDLMKYGFYIVIFFGAVLARGAKAIIDAINKKNQPGSGPGPAMPTQRAAPTARDRSSSPTAPVARPLPPRIRRSLQPPVARPLPGGPTAPSQVPTAPTRSPEEVLIPELVRELAMPQGNVPTRPPEGSARQSAPSAAAWPRRTKSSKAKPEAKKRRSTEERLGHLEFSSRDRHLDPESHLHLKNQTAGLVGGGRGFGDMSSRAALRHAIVMNEILGLPLALRQDDADPWGS